mgnify:CR=1 FL=1
MPIASGEKMKTGKINHHDVYRMSGNLRVVFLIANSTLKPCIKSMRANSSCNPNKNLNLPVLQDFVMNAIFTPLIFSQT